MIGLKSKVRGSILLLLLAASVAHAGIIYTVIDGPGSTFSISKAIGADNGPDFAGSGATLPIDSDDVLIKIDNQSSRILLDILVQGNGSDPFGFDSSGPFTGGSSTYFPAGGSVVLNPSANCGFCDVGHILFPSGLAVAQSAFVAFEDDGTGVFNNAVLSVSAAAAPAPEPATLALVGLGIAALAFKRRKQA